MPTHPDNEIPKHDPQGVDLSRRKLGMGLGVSAVFTLASRPVLAAECLAASSAASGNLSTHGAVPQCTGLTPAQWVALAQNTRPNAPDSPTQNGFPGGNVKFHDAFASGGSANWGQTRLYGVMADGTGASSGRGGFLGSPDNEQAATVPASGPNPVSMEFAATLLNIRDGRVPDAVLSETRLLQMWNEWLISGTYAPMAGATWGTDQIVAYLRTLQGV
jgi:hypothetical protein